MIQSLVLNLQPLLKKDSLFEILLESNETDKKVGPYRIAFDMSPFFNNKKITFSDSDSTFCRSFFPSKHGFDPSTELVDDVKILYQKKPQDPRAFLTSAVNEIKITEDDVNGIWLLEFKVIRDSLYDTTKIDGLYKKDILEDSFSECDGHVASSQFVFDILDNKGSVFNESETFVSSAIKNNIMYNRYKLNYDCIKIVFYGASIGSDFSKIYAKNELYGTKTATIVQLVNNGKYFLKDSGNDYIFDTDEYGDAILDANSKETYTIFTFNKADNAFTNGDETYQYDATTDLFVMNDSFEVDLKNQSILIDTNGNTLQLNPQTGKYVNEAMADISGRDNIVEFTQDFLDLLIKQNNATDLIKSGIVFEDNFNKILINFNFSKIANDTSNSGGNSYSYTDNGEENYYYPNALNIEDDTVKKAVSIGKAKDVSGGEIDGPSIIFDNGLRNDENSYIRDFVMFGHLFEYFTKIEPGVSITETDENDFIFNDISFFEARRRNPLLWHYINFVWDTNKSNIAKDENGDFPDDAIDISVFLANSINSSNVNSDQIGAIFSGEDKSKTSYFDFINLNYYKLSQATRNAHEDVIFNDDNDNNPFPKLITKYSLANPKSTRFNYEDDKEIVRAVVALSQYIDDMELGKKVIQTIVKLTRQMN
jgi:hypothetical protein